MNAVWAVTIKVESYFEPFFVILQVKYSNMCGSLYSRLRDYISHIIRMGKLGSQNQIFFCVDSKFENYISNVTTVNNFMLDECTLYTQPVTVGICKSSTFLPIHCPSSLTHDWGNMNLSLLGEIAHFL